MLARRHPVADRPDSLRAAVGASRSELKWMTRINMIVYRFMGFFLVLSRMTISTTSSLGSVETYIRSLPQGRALIPYGG